MRDHGVQIFKILFINSEMEDLLVTKYFKIYCFIVNNFFRRFIVYCYTIILSVGETCDIDCFVYHTFFILMKK
jgi:hypothetical protein